MFVPSKCLIYLPGQDLGLKREGQGLGLIHSPPSGLWMLRCPKLQAFFESLAQGDFFHIIYSGPMQIFVY